MPQALPFFEALVRLLEVVSWPAVVVISVLLLKPEMNFVLGRLNKFRYGSAEAEFGQALVRAERAAPQSEIRIVRPGDVTPSLDDADRIEQLFQLAKVSSRGAVMDAWRELELAAVGAALALGRKVTGPLDRVSGIAAVEELERHGDVSVGVLNFYRELRSLRNRANSSDFQLSVEDARKYVALAMQLASYFRRIRREAKSKDRSGTDSPNLP